MFIKCAYGGLIKVYTFNKVLGFSVLLFSVCAECEAESNVLRAASVYGWTVHWFCALVCMCVCRCSACVAYAVCLVCVSVSVCWCVVLAGLCAARSRLCNVCARAPDGRVECQCVCVCHIFFWSFLLTVTTFNPFARGTITRNWF